MDHIAIARVEQLYPYPEAELKKLLAKYNKATEVFWVQEEPKNRGAWTFISDRLQPLLPLGLELGYAGRDEAASPATGSGVAHKAEEQELVATALGISQAAPASAPVAATPATATAPAAAVAAASPASPGSNGESVGAKTAAARAATVPEPAPAK
jgi:hypothetical protein